MYKCIIYYKSLLYIYCYYIFWKDKKKKAIKLNELYYDINELKKVCIIFTKYSFLLFINGIKAINLYQMFYSYKEISL